MSKNHENIWTILNHIEHLLILPPEVTEQFSIPAFASLVSIPIGTTSSSVGLKIFVKTAEIKKCKSKFKRKDENMIK